jgi:hypothetical protein
MANARQRRAVRQSLVQAAPGEATDRRVDLRLTHQPPVVHDAQQKPREHQPNGGLRLDPGPPDAGSVEFRHLIVQPRQVEHMIHSSQNALVGNQVAQRAANEKLELTPVLPSDRPAPRSKKSPEPLIQHSTSFSTAPSIPTST